MSAGRTNGDAPSGERRNGDAKSEPPKSAPPKSAPPKSVAPGSRAAEKLKAFHEESAIGKAYDARLLRRL